MKYTFEVCNRIYCISSTYKNTSTGNGWSFKIGNPGQITPVWGGDFNRFLQVKDLTKMVELINSLTTDL